MKFIITESQYRFLFENLNEETILIVGDSHTVDVGWTWSSILKKNHTNVTIRAIGGKRTSWMKEQLIDELLKKHYDKVIIWGGSNDAFSLVSIQKAIKNIQDMVDMVNEQGGKAYVIVGYDYEIFADPDRYKPTNNADKEDMKNFRLKHIDLQNQIADSIKGAVIIPKFNIDNSHTHDNIHGDSYAHRFVYDEVIKYLENDVLPSEENTDEYEENTNKSIIILDNLKKYMEEGREFEYHKRPIPYEKEVEDIQASLQFLVFSLPVWGIDGQFGAETRRAVESFQNSVGLEETGVVQSDELEKLISELESKDFQNFEVSKLQKYKTQNVETFHVGEKIVIDDPNVSVRRYPSDLLERFKEVVGDDYDEFVSGCESIGLNLQTAVRQLYTESGFSPKVINCDRKSTAGAMGIAQFMPSTWSYYGEGGDVCNVSDSLKAYIRLMGDNLKRFPGRPDLAVSSYNSGPNLKAYKKALNDEMPFEELRGRIPEESYKYTVSIFQA